MDKNMLYPLLAIIAILLVAGGIYYFSGSSGAGQQGSGIQGNQTPVAATEAQALFFASMEKPMNYTSYVFAYEETASSGYSVSVYMTQSPGFSYVRKADAVFSRAVFTSGNRTILCLGTVNKAMCTEPSQNSSFNPYVQNLNALLYDPQALAVAEQTNRHLIEYGALTIGPTITEKTYYGTPCREIAYTLDYSKLSLEQMESLGIDPKSAQVVVSKQYNFSLCIDSQNSVVRKRLDYLNLGTPAFSETRTIEIAWGQGQQIPIPTQLSNESPTGLFYNALRSAQQNFATCLVNNGTDACLRQEAITSMNEKLCPIIQNETTRDSCYVNIALLKEKVSLCENVTPSLQDDCYFEFGWQFTNLTYCNMIKNAIDRQNCTDMVNSWLGNETPTSPPPAGNGGNASASGPIVPPGAECIVDSDCVKAGCSSQLCVPSDQAGIITTCEYRSDYDCLPLTRCGCANNKCGWAQTPDYLNCLNSKKST